MRQYYGPRRAVYSSVERNLRLSGNCFAAQRVQAMLPAFFTLLSSFPPESPPFCSFRPFVYSAARQSARGEDILFG